jgi:7-cyano-7-deazaguanine synthase
MNKKRAIVLLSGGIDSSTSLAIAKAYGCDLFAITFDYNQRHNRELESARMVASALGVRKHLITSFDLREIGGSALTSEMEVPKKDRGQKPGSRNQYKTEDDSLSAIPATYVPARNTIFLSFALAWAEVMKAEDIFIGANAIDYSGYPDCRPGYLRAFEDMANLATKASVGGSLRFKIQAPLISMTKAEIIKKGLELGLDYSLTWSCYDPQPQELKSTLTVQRSETKHATFNIQHPELAPCGSCDSCLFREKGFKEAGADDPLLIRFKDLRL